MDNYTCLLCQQTGLQLVPPGYLPNLFMLQEHLVKEHKVSWEDVLHSIPQPGCPAEAQESMEWCLPKDTCHLPQERFLRVVHGTEPPATLFYFVATFPSHEACKQAEREIRNQCKQSDPTSLAGGSGELDGEPVLLFIDLLPGNTPDHSFQLSLWNIIHLYGGICTVLPAEMVESVANGQLEEISARRKAHPNARWAEVDYRSGTTSYDDPKQSKTTSVRKKRRGHRGGSND